MAECKKVQKFLRYIHHRGYQLQLDEEQSLRQISAGEEIACEVLELGYFIGYNGKMVQDPFSLMLSLSAEDLKDERVQICIEEMLEEYVW